MKQWQKLVLAVALGGIVAPVTAPAAPGASPSEVRKQAESSLVVTGKVDIETNGAVSAVAIDHEDKLPQGVVKYVRDNAMRWEFEPVERDGKVVKARAPMRLRVVAKKLDSGDYQIALRGVSFEHYDEKDPESIASISMRPPRYPEDGFRSGASGTVYLVVKVGRDGKVEDVVAEQVNLRVYASEGDMKRLRNLFAKSSIDAARRWSFRTPTQGKAAEQPFWTMRIPVSYALNAQPSEGQDSDYGKWITYIPGPWTPAPWLDAKTGAGFSPDTLSDGGLYMADGSAPRLRTPLQGS